MIEENGGRPRDAQWLHPEAEANDLRRYAATLRERAWVIALAVVLCTFVAIVYVETATPVYTAEAQVLVTPVSGTDATTLSGLGVITASSDPTQDVETAASLVPSIDVARAVQRRLKIQATPQSVLLRVSVQPISQSNILAVSADAPSASQAAA